jgi:predicted ATPase
VGRAELAALLWPDLAQKLASTNLRKTLFRLASAPWAPQVANEGGALRVDLDTDVAQFESAVRGERAAEALALRTGELLAGFEDDANRAWSSWLSFERERLRTLWRDAALARLAGDIDASAGIELSARLLEADPLDEAALAAHMTWLGRSGQGARARQAYRDFAARMERELGLAPNPALASANESIALPVRAPAEAVADDGFVGRAVELKRMTSLMSDRECRLLALVGPGGAGKTRLARRALQALAPMFADGAIFVPLEDVASGRELAARMAGELEVSLKGGRDPLSQVIEHAKDRHMLLVLDNFEQLAAEAPVIERMLVACPRMRIIVTSRVRLALASEWLLPIDGLPCPESEDRDRLEAFDASRLFVQAARRVDPALVPAAEAASIVDICHAVEGLPLALELAATWTRVLSCEAIAAELRKGSALLHSAEASQPPRHASFDVVFEHSWQLLGDRERDALSRLSVFRGGFAADAARAVAAAPLAVLGALSDKSLLRKDGARLFMHPLVAQSAAARLGDGDAREEAERAHASHFGALLAQLRRGVEDGDRDALQRVELEMDNCKAAWRWAVAHDASDLIARSASVLLYFWDHRGRLEEGLALLREAQSAPAVTGRAPLEAHILACAAHLEYRLDRYADAIDTAQRAMARAPRDKATRLQGLKVLAACSLRLGKHDEAKAHYLEALRQAPETSDPHNAAALLDNLALVEKELGNYQEALDLSLRSLSAHRRLRDAAGEALCLNNLGALYLDRRDYQAAGVHLREGLAIAERHGLVSNRGLILANLTEYAIRSNEVAAAEDYAQRALDVARNAGNRSIESWLLLQVVRLALRRGDLDAARTQLAASLGLAVDVASPSLQMAGVTCFAEIVAAQGDGACARRVLHFAQAHALTTAAQAAEIRALMAGLPEGNGAWPDLELPELVHRIRSEAPLAHSPLLATLRTA